jgi:hypothetical protein
LSPLSGIEEEAPTSSSPRHQGHEPERCTYGSKRIINLRLWLEKP